jgi:formiminotetrahydrofolate cyclodeaminase
MNIPNPTGLRITAAPFFAYLSWYILTHEPPHPYWVILLTAFASFLSYRIFKADRDKMNFEQNLNTSTHMRFNFDFPNHVKADFPKPIKRDIDAFKMVLKGLLTSKYSQEEAVNVGETLLQTQNYSAASKWFELALKSDDSSISERAELGKLIAVNQEQNIALGNFDTYQLTMLQTKVFIEIKNMNAIEFTYLITDKSSDLEAISKLPEVQRQLLISLITEVAVSNGHLDS